MSAEINSKFGEQGAALRAADDAEFVSTYLLDVIARIAVNVRTELATFRESMPRGYTTWTGSIIQQLGERLTAANVVQSGWDREIANLLNRLTADRLSDVANDFRRHIKLTTSSPEEKTTARQERTRRTR